MYRYQTKHGSLSWWWAEVGLRQWALQKLQLVSYCEVVEEGLFEMGWRVVTPDVLVWLITHSGNWSSWWCLGTETCACVCFVYSCSSHCWGKGNFGVYLLFLEVKITHKTWNLHYAKIVSWYLNCFEINLHFSNQALE